MTDAFEKAFAYLIINEGVEFTDHPNDPGGPTKYGVTQMTLAQWRGVFVTWEDVQNLSIEEAKQIYFARYWLPLGLDDFTQSVGTCLFDSGVLYGIRISAKLAQETVNDLGGSLSVDGFLGPLSRTAITKLDDSVFIGAYYHALLARIDALIDRRPALQKFRATWERRAAKLLTLAPYPEKITS